MTDLPDFENFDENTDLESGVGGEGQEQSGKEIELISSSKVAWLQEVGFTVTKILVLVVTLLVITLSIVAKVEWWIIILRAGVCVLLLGFLGYLLNWLLGKYLVEAKLAELKEKKEIEDAEEAERLSREQAEMEALTQLQEQENEELGFEIET